MSWISSPLKESAERSDVKKLVALDIDVVWSDLPQSIIPFEKAREVLLEFLPADHGGHWAQKERNTSVER